MIFLPLSPARPTMPGHPPPLARPPDPFTPPPPLPERPPNAPFTKITVVFAVPDARVWTREFGSVFESWLA